MDATFRQSLKAKAHHLKPVVYVGAKGLTAAVVEETNAALLAHELVKVKISGVEKAERHLIANDLCAQVRAELVQAIGNIAIIYRKNEERLPLTLPSPTRGEGKSLSPLWGRMSINL
ncbi:putative RNA-binding protein [Legionella lansingensis]|uniref:Putative RNA-binding protein n=1 Tax=Legionella lansingensis TaxID=45067 RepID=A0A0W0VRN1_9GAMM|nr:putative RNA-binding protein [Legionella lansingensis]SNV55754.1 putative RNA-binding protein [Legionella lansingensis]